MKKRSRLRDLPLPRPASVPSCAVWPVFRFSARYFPAGGSSSSICHVDSMNERISRHAYTDATYLRKRERDTMRLLLLLATTVISQLSLLSPIGVSAFSSSFSRCSSSDFAIPSVTFSSVPAVAMGVELRLDGYMYLGLPRPNLNTSRRHRQNSSLSRVRCCSSVTNREGEREGVV